MLPRTGYRTLLGLAILSLSFTWASTARAQNQNNAGQVAGVVIDANGVLSVQVPRDPTGQLHRARIAAAQEGRDPKLAAPSPLRKISLNRLEREVEAQLANDRKPTDEVQHLAGLLRVQYVFFYPESGDIVLAGPAEGWAEDISGRFRGITSGRPVMELQDLVVALRAYPPGKDQGPVIGCSIDPTKEGLAALHDFLKQVGATSGPGIDPEPIVAGMRNSLGLQNVTVLGVAPNTHFAQVLVEADYRMKLIGIGLERPPVKLASYVDQASPSQVSRNAMQRWFFVPDYQCVRVSDDDLAMELVGLGVKLVNADEVVNPDGSRASTGSVDRASRSFVQGFTKKYPDLAARSPVFAQLRNLIDLAIAAAYIQRQDYYGKAGWKMETLGNEERFAVETYPTPLRVETAVNAIFKGSRLMLPIGGGVHIDADQALITDNQLPDENGAVQKLRGETSLDHLAEGQWWWD